MLVLPPFSVESDQYVGAVDSGLDCLADCLAGGEGDGPSGRADLDLSADCDRSSGGHGDDAAADGRDQLTDRTVVGGDTEGTDARGCGGGLDGSVRVRC